MDSNIQNHTGLSKEEDKIHSKHWVILIIVLLAAFMNLIDASIVGVAIPVIQKDLNITFSVMQWVLAAYSLAFALLLITGGRLGDIFGRKRVFILGVSGFTIASVLCGISQNSAILIGARALQGSMAAIMVPQVLSIIQVTFPPKQRGAAFGMYGGIAGLATVIGPLIGALITQGNFFGLQWRPLFLINL